MTIHTYRAHIARSRSGVGSITVFRYEDGGTAAQFAEAVVLPGEVTTDVLAGMGFRYAIVGREAGTNPGNVTNGQTVNVPVKVLHLSEVELDEEA